MNRTLSKVIAVVGAASLGAVWISPANAFTVSQDGLGINVTATQNSQTVSFVFEADFTGATTSWIGDTMDAFSLQFGNVGQGGHIASFTTPLTIGNGGTTAAGNWTGYKDKQSGQGCTAADDDAICYTVNPTAEGGDGAQIITATKYKWFFDVTFKDGFNVGTMLAAPHSIKFLSVKQLNNGKWTTGNQLSRSGTFNKDCPLGDPTCNQQVPEPGSLALLAMGLLGLGLGSRRKSVA